METTELTRAMREATDGLQTDAGFASTVLRGGRRRKRRGQLMVAGASVFVAAVAGVGMWATVGGVDEPSMQVAGPEVTSQHDWLFEGPTRGDLADDERFIDQALEAWRTGIAKSPNDTGRSVTGEPHVYWAGNTAAGRVALVAQNTTESPVLGLIAGEQPKLVNEAPSVMYSPRDVAFLFGPGDRYALALRRGERVAISPEWPRNADGTGHREWWAMREVDEVVLFDELSAGTNPAGVRVARWGIHKAETSEEAHDLSLATFPSTRYHLGWDRQSKIVIDNRLPWPRDLVFEIGKAKKPAGEDGDRLFHAAERAGMQDPLNVVWLSGFSVVATLPDGSNVEAFELQPSIGPTGFYALITKEGTEEPLVYGGQLDPERPLPARVELPGDQGWIVAHYQAKLRYRSAEDGPWTDAGQNAALLPQGAVQVEVTLPGKAPEVVNLKG